VSELAFGFAARCAEWLGLSGASTPIFGGYASLGGVAAEIKWLAGKA